MNILYVTSEAVPFCKTGGLADVAGSLPHGRVHEDGGVDTHDIAVHQHHRLPPIFLDIILKLNAVLTVVIHGGETVVNV